MLEKVYVNNVTSDKMVNVGANEEDGLFLHEVSFEASPGDIDTPHSLKVEKVFLPEEYKSVLRHQYYVRTI